MEFKSGFKGLNFGLPVSIIPYYSHRVLLLSPVVNPIAVNKYIYLYQRLRTYLQPNTYYFMRRTSGLSVGTFKQGSILLEIRGALGREVSSGATRSVRCTSVSQKGGGSRVTMTWRAGGGGCQLQGDLSEVSRIDLKSSQLSVNNTKPAKHFKQTL